MTIFHEKGKKIQWKCTRDPQNYIYFHSIPDNVLKNHKKMSKSRKTWIFHPILGFRPRARSNPWKKDFRRKKKPISSKMDILAQKSNSIYPLPYSRTSSNFGPKYSFLTRWGFFLRRIFCAKMTIFPYISFIKYHFV